MTVWIAAEAELVTVQLANGWNVKKHYDLVCPDDLELEDPFPRYREEDKRSYRSSGKSMRQSDSCGHVMTEHNRRFLRIDHAVADAGAVARSEPGSPFSG
jgi:hypothetical protein